MDPFYPLAKWSQQGEYPYLEQEEAGMQKESNLLRVTKLAGSIAGFEPRSLAPCYLLLSPATGLCPWSRVQSQRGLGHSEALTGVRTWWVAEEVGSVCDSGLSPLGL